jgi:hypothetical protein
MLKMAYGVMEYWSDGVLEYWSIGVLVLETKKR